MGYRPYSLIMKLLLWALKYYHFLVQSLSHVWLFANPWTAARQVSLPFPISWSLRKLISMESMMPSKHPIFCHPLLLLPSYWIFIISQFYNKHFVYLIWSSNNYITWWAMSFHYFRSSCIVLCTHVFLLIPVTLEGLSYFQPIYDLYHILYTFHIFPGFSWVCDN